MHRGRCDRASAVRGDLVITALRSRRSELAAVAERAARELADATAEEILRFAADEFGSGLAVTASMQDTVLVHLASKVLPGIDVLFLDTGYHFIETIGTADAVEAVYDVTLRRLLPLQTVARAGRPVRQGPVRQGSGSVLCTAQGRAAEQGTDRIRGLGDRCAAGGIADPRQHPGRAVRRQAREGQVRPAGRLVRRRGRRLHHEQQRAGQSVDGSRTIRRSAASPAPAGCCPDRMRGRADGPGSPRPNVGSIYDDNAERAGDLASAVPPAADPV